MSEKYKYITVIGECEDVGMVGGKGANLGKMVRAGFPVPGGFVVDTRGYRFGEIQNSECRIQNEGAGVGTTVAKRVEVPVEVREEILGAYREMGGGAVAVRSSATAEDMEGASMAGQYETYLDVRGEEELIEKVGECWASLDMPRVRAYLAEHGIEQSKVGMAVVVQRLVESEVAGVMFTVNPVKGLGDRGKGIEEMLIEASWGLGESVVGGKVQPDVVRVDGQTGVVLEMEIADKRVELVAGTREEREVEEGRRRKACLGVEEVRMLWELGKKAEGHFGMPQDLEWSIAGGKTYLLQSRPITTSGEGSGLRLGLGSEIEAVREVVFAELKGWMGEGRGPWVLHNLAETLAHPTPLTWSVMKRFMSGDGGFGKMYRMAGFEPSAKVCQEGFLDLIGGRIYMDVSRAPEMFFEAFPFAYDLEELKRNPEASQNPPTVPTGTLRERMRTGKRLAAANVKLRGLAEEFDRTLRDAHFPAMTGYVATARETDLRRMSNAALVTMWEMHETWVMDEFAPMSLLPSMICGMALGELQAFLEEHLWDEDGEALADLLSSGGLANRTVMADAELYEVGRSLAGAGSFTTEPQRVGRRTEDGTEARRREGREVHEDFEEKKSFESTGVSKSTEKRFEEKCGEEGLVRWIEAHGHRAPGEFELGILRWRERVEEVRGMAVRMARGGEKPLERHGRVSVEVNRRVAAVRGKLRGEALMEFDAKLEMVRRYVPFREDGKDYLMMGYELLRVVALEMGRRLGVGEEVVYLTKEEVLGEMREIENRKLEIEKIRGLVAERKRRYLAEGKIEVPRVVDGAWVEGMGEIENRKLDIEKGEGVKAFVLSGGVGRGWALVLRSPTEAGEFGTGYILVCPSTDPSWTPLFVNAAGLVMECGGRLSHGAVVAREMGLPAVVVGDATRRFKDGEEIIVDGDVGAVGKVGEMENRKLKIEKEGVGAVDSEDTRVGRMMVPPRTGGKDRRSGRVRNVMAGLWSVFIVAFFLLPPAWVYGPTLAFLDIFLWPVVRACGKPWTVAMVAAGIGVVTLMIQRFTTDNARLLEAKRRAGVLMKEAEKLPAGCARRKALMALAMPVQLRTLGAALVPVGILLGPMVLPFVWFGARIDPGVKSAPAGTAVTVVASVDSEYRGVVRAEAPAGFVLAEDTPAEAKVPAIRETLEALLAAYRTGTGDEAMMKAAPERSEKTMAELAAYLAKGVPAQTLRWKLTPGKDLEGRYMVRVTAGGRTTEVPVVLGEVSPPGAKEVEGAGPVRQVRVAYNWRAEQKDMAFWQPFGAGGWDVGWVWVYILAYLPVLFGTRAILKVA